MNWLEIADACEKATGPSREIDEAILSSLGFYVHGAGSNGPHWNKRGTGIWFDGKPTSSIDAIVALIERELPGWMARVQWCGVSAEAWVAPDLNNPLCPQEIRADPERWHDYAERNEVELRPGSIQSATLSLCAAFARAMHEKGK